VRLLLLHLDDALELQPSFMRTCVLSGGEEHYEKRVGKAVRLWSKDRDLADLGRSISNRRYGHGSGSKLSFLGSGDFHHITALLLDDALQGRTAPTTLIHFDNHPDWVKFDGGMHCGSWINRALAMPNISKLITVGVCSNDLRGPERKGANLRWLREGRMELYPYAHSPSRVSGEYGTGGGYSQKGGELHWKTIADLGEENFIGILLDRVKTEAVYITIDKDVLAPDDAATNWDQGQMRLPYLLKLLSELGRRHRIVGADVIGDYSVPSYGGNPFARVAKKVEVLIDQPWVTQTPAAKETINSAANHALLEILAGYME
jgi:hypothetical protein